MTVFLVSDIFGRTPALENICKALSLAVPEVAIIDPYCGIQHNFKDEAHAYSFFMEQTGLKKYQSILANRLNNYTPDTVLIGFSTGASAIWGISNQPSFAGIKKAFGFYGSQIRHQTDIKPLFGIELIFPKKEEHFNVDSLINQLKNIPYVTCKKAEGMHGFMNSLSDGFNPACYSKQMDYLIQLL